MLAESLALLEEIKSGARLPQRSSELNRPPDTHGVRMGEREREGERGRREEGGGRREEGGGKRGRWERRKMHYCCYMWLTLLLQGSSKFSNSLPLHDPRNIKVDCTQWKSSPFPQHLKLQQLNI